MKVLLVNPPAEHIIRESLPSVVEDSTGFYPPLGLLYVAAYAEGVDECEVRVWDCQAERIACDELERKIRAYGPDVVGIQAMTFTLIDALCVARAAKKARPGCFVVMGGPHPTLYPEESVLLPDVDCVVRGEGEYPFEALLKAIRGGHSVDGIPGVITRRGVSESQPVEGIHHIKNLDALKRPARHLLDPSLYSSPLASQRHVTTMMSSRGCPGKCIFCDRPQMGKILRKRSAESVVAEMAFCVRELGIGEILFYDDTFNIDKARVIEICERILCSGLKVRWGIRARVDAMTPEIIRHLRKAGCNRISYGVETGSQRLQKLIRKNLDLDQVREVFALTQREGIETLGYFMIGLPTEKKEEVDETVELMLSMPMDYAHIAVFTPYPGTTIYHDALTNGIYDVDYWRVFARNPIPDFVPRYWDENFTGPMLMEILKSAYSKFYGRPSYMVRRLSKIRSARDFFRKASLGIKLLSEVYFRK
jgi:anaerobic magnesium-protoporphyrin IX monomethyl ester cyclase